MKMVTGLGAKYVAVVSLPLLGHGRRGESEMVMSRNELGI